MRSERAQAILFSHRCAWAGHAPAPCASVQKIGNRHADRRCNPRIVADWIREGTEIAGNGWDGEILKIDWFTGDVLVSGDDGEPPVWIDIVDLPFVASPEE